jgi:hypothetical protein
MSSPDATLLTAMANLTEFHREHEKFYSVAPREQAVMLQRHSRRLHALSDRWATTTSVHSEALNPFEGATDLNAPGALQLEGVLFMEGGDEPVEISHLLRDLRTSAEDAIAAGRWLADAMQSSWDFGRALLDIDAFADLLGERHRIISNNWHAASLMTLAGEVLDRAAEVLDRVDFTPGAVRRDLEGARVFAPRIASAAEMIDHAADLFSDFAGLVHDNERRWRVFRARVEALAAEVSAGSSSA